MRKIRIMEHTSLDGVVQDEDGEGFSYGGWTAPYRTPAGRAAVMEAQGGNFDLLLGRRTYDAWAGYWPKAGESPIASAMNAATKYVATHRPQGLGWGPVGDLGADVVDGIRRVKSMDGPDLVVWGSVTLARLLLHEGLADELVLIVYPLLLGGGNRLFSENAGASEFALVGTKATPTGVLLNTYRHVGPLRAKSPAGAGG